MGDLQNTSLPPNGKILLFLFLRAALYNVSTRKYLAESDISRRKLRSRERQQHTHTRKSNTVGTKLLIQFFFPLPLSPPPHAPFLFSGYTYNLPRVLDNTCIFQLFLFSRIFPMKILLFPLSDMTQDHRLASLTDPYGTLKDSPPQGDTWMGITSPQLLHSHQPWPFLQS